MFANVSGTTSTNPQYPVNGRGTVSTTAGSSHVGTNGVEVTGIILTTAVAGNVTIADHAGTSGYAIIVPVTTDTVVPVVLPLPKGEAFFTPGVRFTASASGLNFTVLYRPTTG